MLTPEQLAEIKARCEAANRGPWRLCGMQVRGPQPGISDDDAGVEHSRLIAATWDEERGLFTWNAQFIACARADVPALLAEVERLRAEVAGLEEWIHEYQQSALEQSEWEP